jgi:Ca2+-binding RTX toxin-like protein
MGKSGTTLTVKGTRGDDPNIVIPGNAALTSVVIDGLAGSDTLNLSNYASGVTVLLEGGFAKASSTVSEKDFTGLWNNFTLAGSTTAKGTVKSIENLVGTDFNDFLFINIHTTAKFIDGGAGNDVVNSLGGNATLVGGTGSDWLVGYWQNVTLIGGTWNGTLATPDGETDYFYSGSQCPVILDFEVGIDQLICEFSTGTLADWLAGTWVASGTSGSTLMVGGVAEVTLANVGPLLAETIEIGYAVLPINGTIQGASGNDLLFVGGVSPTRIILGTDNGDDAAIGFDILSDVLVFEDGIVPIWSDTMVNGAPALLGTWADGSITLQGLSTADVDNLITENMAMPPAFGPPGPGAWSNAGDADFGATALLAG